MEHKNYKIYKTELIMQVKQQTYLFITQLEQVHKFRYLEVALNDKQDPDVSIKTTTVHVQQMEGHFFWMKLKRGQ